MHEALQYQALLELVNQIHSGQLTPNRTETNRTKLSAEMIFLLVVLTSCLAQESQKFEATPTETPQIVIVEEDHSQMETETPEIRFFREANGSLRIQTSNFEGTCKIVYVLEGEELTDDLKNSRGWGEQNCQVNRNLETALLVVPEEFQVEDFRGEGKVKQLFFLVRQAGGWENAKSVDITSEILN